MRTDWPRPWPNNAGDFHWWAVRFPRTVRNEPGHLAASARPVLSRIPGHEEIFTNHGIGAVITLPVAADAREPDLDPGEEINEVCALDVTANTVKAASRAFIRVWQGSLISFSRIN